MICSLRIRFRKRFLPKEHIIIVTSAVLPIVAEWHIMATAACCVKTPYFSLWKNSLKFKMLSAIFSAIFRQTLKNYINVIQMDTIYQFLSSIRWDFANATFECIIEWVQLLILVLLSYKTSYQKTTQVMSTLVSGEGWLSTLGQFYQIDLSGCQWSWQQPRHNWRCIYTPATSIADKDEYVLWKKHSTQCMRTWFMCHYADHGLVTDCFTHLLRPFYWCWELPWRRLANKSCE